MHAYFSSSALRRARSRHRAAATNDTAAAIIHKRMGCVSPVWTDSETVEVVAVGLEGLAVSVGLVAFEGSVALEGSVVPEDSVALE